MSSPPTAAQWVVREILGASSQKELLACRRTLVTAGRVASTLKRDLVPELSELCEDVGLRRRICNEILAGYAVKDLRSLITRLRAHGCLVRVGPRPKRDDLASAIVDIDAFATTGGRASASSGSSAEIGPSNTETPTAWLRQSDSDDELLINLKSSSAQAEDRPVPNASTTPDTSMALVAFESSADPGKLQKKLIKRWGKKRRKEKLGRLESVLKDTLDEHAGLPTTVDELRGIVGQTLGISLQGSALVTFYKVLFKLTAPPPTKTRSRRRFKVGLPSQECPCETLSRPGFGWPPRARAYALALWIVHRAS